MLGGWVEPAKTQDGPWRGRLWYYQPGTSPQVMVRDVMATRALLPLELGFAAAALVVAPDVKQALTSKPTFCADSPPLSPDKTQPTSKKKNKNKTQPKSQTVVELSFYRRDELRPYTQELREVLKTLVGNLGFAQTTHVYRKPRHGYAGPKDPPPERPPSALIEVELWQGNDFDGGDKKERALKELHLRWRGAASQADPQELSLAVPIGTRPEGMAPLFTEILRAKLASVADSLVFSRERGSLSQARAAELCEAFSPPKCSPTVEPPPPVCSSGPEPQGCEEIFCAEHPKDRRCQADPCAVDPKAPACIASYCGKHPESPICSKPACGASGLPPCPQPGANGTFARKTLTYVLAGLAAIPAGFFIWRAIENNQSVAGDCPLQDEPMVNLKNSCIQKTWPSMLGTGIPALGLVVGAFALWPYGAKDSPAKAAPPPTQTPSP
jgi:hypothetical protein